MGYKNVCLDCKISFCIGNDFANLIESNCPNCSTKIISVNQKFKPPKKSDAKAWKTVRLLVENGFRFQSVYEPIQKGVYLKVNYPNTFAEAETFVKKHKP